MEYLLIWHVKLNSITMKIFLEKQILLIIDTGECWSRVCWFSTYVYAAGMSVNTMNQINDILQHPIHQEKYFHFESNPRPLTLQAHTHLTLHCPELRHSKS